jgi:hypothetical protein
VREAFFQALGALDPERLMAEIAEARARLAVDFTEANERRLVALVQAQGAVAGAEHDAPQAARPRAAHT